MCQLAYVLSRVFEFTNFDAGKCMVNVQLRISSWTGDTDDRTFRPFTGRYIPWTFRPLDVLPWKVSPPGHFAHSLYVSPQIVGVSSPIVGISSPSVFLCVCFFWAKATLPELIKLIDWCTFFTFKSLHLYTITCNTAKFCWNIHTNDGTFNVIQNCTAKINKVKDLALIFWSMSLS